MKVVLLIGILFVASSISMVYAQTSSLPMGTAKLGNVTLSLEIANTPTSMEKGLMYHAPLSFNQGMLFVFNPPQQATMWMKNMQFPIDMIWFDSNGNILHMEKNLPPCTGPDSSCPLYDGNSQNTSYVLEVASGFIDHFGISNQSKFIMINPLQSTSTSLPNLKVPEFGSLAGIVLAVSIVSIIAISAKIGLRIMPKK